MNYNIYYTDGIEDNFSYFNYIEFVNKVLRKTSDKKQEGITKNIEIVDAEPSSRVYLKCGNKDFWIRYYIIHCSEKEYCADWTLWSSDEGNNSYRVSSGNSVIKYKQSN